MLVGLFHVALPQDSDLFAWSAWPLFGVVVSSVAELFFSIKEHRRQLHSICCPDPPSLHIPSGLCTKMLANCHPVGASVLFAV